MTDISFNRLSEESSTYLKQHKDNPVHWWAWGPEAIQRAKDENKPIFLSVGYSSCHWCHVMADESFKDEETANFLNENFINIKVDREEFPDIDNYYQQACHLFTQSGGWPLSAFLLPDLKPYFVGTYFPKAKTQGGTPFMELLSELTRAYNDDIETVSENASKVTKAIEEGFIPNEKVDFQGHFPPPNAVMEVIKEFKDEENGGFGEAPKFPQFSFYEYALEQMLEGMMDKDHGEHIILSLEKMLMGGINDHARGGIHRYSTDKTWTVPHFEKMLYDQAGFLKVLSKLSLLYPSPLVFDSIYNTLEYLNNEMLDEKGYFFSAQDADSEGVEGLYFTVTEEEFEDCVSKFPENNEELVKNIDQLKKWFGISKDGNFDSGLNIVTLKNEHASEFFTPEGWELVRTARKALLLERKMRVPPQTDNKGIASWNFMLTSALSDVMQYCQVAPIRSIASNLFNKLVEGSYNHFINTETGSMRVEHTTTRKNSLPYLEDYVFFAENQLRIYELSGNPVFKQNLLDTLSFIKDQFVDGDKCLTRAKKANDHELYPNQAYSSFDQSFKSPVSTLLLLARRASVLFKDVNIIEDLKELKEKVTHEVLKNPIGSGEGLRALSYPEDAYKVLKCPKAWLDKEEFANFICYFMPRFVLDYHEEENENFEICSIDKCELTGNGLEEFIKTLRPSPEEEAQQ